MFYIKEEQPRYSTHLHVFLVSGRIEHAGPQKVLVESRIRGEFGVKSGEQMAPLPSGDYAARVAGIFKVVSAVGRAMLRQPSEDLNRWSGSIIRVGQG